MSRPTPTANRRAVYRWLKANPEMRERARYLLAVEIVESEADMTDEERIEFALDGSKGVNEYTLRQVADDLADLFGAEYDDFDIQALKDECIEPC